MSRWDRAIGIALGVLIGLAIIILFVFLGSEETIDAPSIEGGPPAERPADADRRER